MTILTTTARIYVRFKKQRGLHADDFALFVSVVLYITMCALYIVDLPYLYAVLDYTSGQVAITPELPHMYAEMMKINYAVTPLFWAVLWSVKVSLLLFFRRVIQYTAWLRIWWVIFIFTTLTFVGCLVSQLLSCYSLKSFTTLGK